MVNGYWLAWEVAYVVWSNVQRENVKHIIKSWNTSNVKIYKCHMSDIAQLLISVGGHIHPVIKCRTYIHVKYQNMKSHTSDAARLGYWLAWEVTYTSCNRMSCAMNLMIWDYWSRVMDAYIVRTSADRTSWAYYDLMRPLYLKFKGFLTICFMVRLHRPHTSCDCMSYVVNLKLMIRRPRHIHRLIVHHEPTMTSWQPNVHSNCYGSLAAAH